MVGSGSGLVGLARNFVCNFRVGSGFFEFRVKFWPVPDPSLARVGSGRVFFGWVGSGLSGWVTRDQAYFLVSTHNSAPHHQFEKDNTPGCGVKACSPTC